MRDALVRFGRIADPPVEPIVPAASQYGYRNKLEYSFTQTEEGPALGFHRAGRWDEVLPIEVCLLTTDLGNAIRDAVQAWAREEKLEAYGQATQRGYLRHLVVREGRNTGQVLVQLVTAQGQEVRGGVPHRGAAEVPRGAIDPLGGQRHARRGDEPADRAALGRGRDRGGDSRTALPRAAERVPADEHGDGRDALLDRTRVRGADGRRDGLRPLLRHRHDRARARPQALTVWGVEISEESVACAIENAELNEIANAAFFAGNVCPRSRSCSSAPARPTSSSSIRRAPGWPARRSAAWPLAAPRIVYVSCNPTTLASDLKALREEFGYELRRCVPVDMFPHTPHIECVNLLELGGARANLRRLLSSS